MVHIVGPGPDSFFKHAKSILPWHDEPDSPQAVVEKPVTTFCPAVAAPPILEKNPHEQLPADWQRNPLQSGIAISVTSPSLSAGNILKHCKAGDGSNSSDSVCQVFLSFAYENRTRSKFKTSGTVQDQVQRIRERHGGINLAVFKIGITHCLELRVLHYYDLNFDEMCCIHASQSLAQIEALEASLIDSFSSEAPQCRNILPGGRGCECEMGSQGILLLILFMLLQPMLPK